MLKRGYNKSLAAGSVTAAGALAVLIPPSISFIIYGARANVSVGKLFIGGIIPGVALAVNLAMGGGLYYVHGQWQALETQHKAKIISFNKNEPTLEDVFIQMVGRGLE